MDDFVLDVLRIFAEADSCADLWWRTDGEYAPVTFLVFLFVMFPALAFVAGFLALFALVFVHLVGEGICNALQRRGVHLRPRVRPCGGQR